MGEARRLNHAGLIIDIPDDAIQEATITDPSTEEVLTVGRKNEESPEAFARLCEIYAERWQVLRGSLQGAQKAVDLANVNVKHAREELDRHARLAAASSE